MVFPWLLGAALAEGEKPDGDDMVAVVGVDVWTITLELRMRFDEVRLRRLGGRVSWLANQRGRNYSGGW